MKVESIALGHLTSAGILRSALEELSDDFPLTHVTMCTEDGDAAMYFTNMTNQAITYLMQGCILEAQGVFDAEAED